MLKIEDNYPKYVVTMDEFNSNKNFQGIEQVHLRDFLCMSKSLLKTRL
jgi:predicted AAA+ superfamily ATPase